MNVPRSNAVELMSSRWLLVFFLAGLTIFLVVAAGGPLNSTDSGQYLPMQARYIDFFGLSRPLHSFFFWALLGIISISILLRGMRQGASITISIFLIVAFITGSSGMLATSKAVISSGMTVDLPETGQLNMDPGSVYQINVKKQTEKVTLRMTDAGPIVVKGSSGGLTAFMPLKNSGRTARVRLCQPEKLGISNMALILDALALLALFSGLGLSLFAGKKS